MQETYKIENRNWAAKLLAVVVVLTMVTSTFVLFAPEASARTGEDPTIGYTFKDQDSGAVYDWKELTTSSTATRLIDYTTDGAQGPFDFEDGFTFEMFTREYTTWGNSGDNGFITLGGTASNMWTPYNIPYQPAGTAIFGAWFDGGFCTSVDPLSGVWYDLQGTAPNREFIVQYKAHIHWSPAVSGCTGAGATDSLTWEIILHEGTNEITVQWQDAKGGWGSDNEWLTTGIQGKTDDGLVGLEYVYRGSPAQVDHGDVVLYMPPPPLKNDLKLKSTIIPDPVSLAKTNPMGAKVFSNGINCEPVDDCTSVNETNIEVNAQVFSVAENKDTYDFDDRTVGDFAKMNAADNDVNCATSKTCLQGTNAWTTALNDGVGNFNVGDEDVEEDGAWSSGRKSLTLGGMFTDNQGIHASSDGNYLLVANMRKNEIVRVDAASHSSEVIMGPDTTNLMNVLDITDDGTHYYTLSRAANLNAQTTKICKWDMTTPFAMVGSCNTTNVKYGVSLTYYLGEVFALQGGSTSTAFRKVIILDASDLTATGADIGYYQSISAYAYAAGIDADDDTGDMYIYYRDYNGIVRAYAKQSGGGYCITSSCYTQVNTYARYGTGIDVEGGYAYVTGYYGSTNTYYGGMKKIDTTSKGVTTMWSTYGDNWGYRGALAVMPDGDIYVASNYAYRYYNFQNYDDKIMHYECSVSCNNLADDVLGPNPASLSALSTKSYDTSSAIGMSMSFKVSWNFYYMYEGAYLEVSTDGATWSHVGADAFTKGGYYGTTYATYNNPLDITKDAWTYYNTNNAYVSYSNDAPWKDQELNLDKYTGYNDVRFRWVVGFNQYNMVYYNSFFRLDDVVITVKAADVLYKDETQIIDTLGFKESADVVFFGVGGGNEFIPKDTIPALSAGDSVAVLIKINNTNNDQKIANNRIIAFRDIKYVMFADDFEDGVGADWTTGSINGVGSTDWAVRSNDAFGGSYSMDSGYKNPSGVSPAANWVSSPALDLSIAVSANAQFMMSYYGYYTYDGYQAQVSDDGWASYETIKPVDTSQYMTMYNSAYWGNPLRGQLGYTMYGTSTGFTYEPSPQGWVKTELDLTPWVGQSDIQVRIVTGWTTLCCGAYYQTFFRLDDFAVTGVVLNNNVGLTSLDIPDPIEVGSTIPVGTTIVNAGLQDQDSGAAKMRMELGPMGVVALPELSDDLESYSTQGAAETAGWSVSTGAEGCNTLYGSCSTWGLYGGISGFNLDADDGSGVTGTQTSWGPNSNRDEFQMYYGGGTSHVETPVYDLSSAPDDLSLTLTHRYNFDYFAGYTSFNGGQVQISTDGGVSWAAIVPEGGYTGTMYNYAGYGNPLYGQPGFVHCGDCSGVNPRSPANEDKYIDSLFDMKDYVGIDDVRIKFVTGMYGYQYPGDGEHWQIGGLTFSGTGMDKTIFSKTVPIVGTGEDGKFVSGESILKSWDYTFIVPGMYKIVFDAWIGATPESGDDFLGDNKKSAVRETMFQVAGTTADGVRLTPKAKNEHFTPIAYSDEWTSSVDGGPANSYKWQTTVDAATGSDSGSPVWWTGTDVQGSTYNGDDTSLTSPVFDLSRSTAAKFMMKHRYSMHGFEYDWGCNCFDGGRIEISTNAGATWSPITPTSGETYTYSIYSYAAYGHPFPNQPAFTMGSSGGGVTGTWVTSEVRLDDYTGDGFDQMQIRIRLGGSYLLNPTEWQVDDVGIYGLGFDLSQTGVESAPYTLELGESATISTQVRNLGSGDLGSGGLVEEGYAFAYVCEVDLCADDWDHTHVTNDQYTWTQSTSLGNLGQAYFEEVVGSDPVEYTTNSGSTTSTIEFTYPGTTAAGVYTAGVRISSDDSGTHMSDLFAKNNEHEHMLIVGMSTAGVTLTADDTWSEVANEPSDVGDGALGTSWDKTDLNTIMQDISILGVEGGGYVPGDITIQAGTTVKWTNNDNIAHTVTDREGNWAGSGSMSATESFTMPFSEVGTYTYYCEYHPGMEGTITVVADIRADKQVQTNYMKVWSADAYLVFWANFDLGSSDTITVYAQAKGAGIDDSTSIRLGSADGFNIVDGTDHDTVGDSLVGMSNGWNPYYMYLSTGTSTTTFLEYDPEDLNEYSFVFRARGVEGSAEFGGVQIIRANEFGTFFSKSVYSKLSYDIFPSLAVEVEYFVKNTGIKDNTFQFTPILILESNPDADNGNWEIQPNAVMDGTSVTLSGTSVGDDIVYSLSLSPDDEAKLTIRFVAPAYNAVTGLPAGNSKYNIDLNPFDVNSNVSIRDNPFYNLYIKPSQFVLGEMSFDRQSVVEGKSLNITVKAWNEGNYASNVLVVMYAKDPSGKMVKTPDGIMRMTRIASTSVDVMAPKPVLEDQGIYKTWYEATATWDKASIPGTSVQDYTAVDIYAWINPDPVEQEDLDKGFKIQDEYQDTTDDNSALGSIHIIKDKSSTPSFAVGLLGMSIAALVAAAGASLRREEE